MMMMNLTYFSISFFLYTTHYFFMNITFHFFAYTQTQSKWIQSKLFIIMSLAYFFLISFEFGLKYLQETLMLITSKYNFFLFMNETIRCWRCFLFRIEIKCILLLFIPNCLSILSHDDTFNTIFLSCSSSVVWSSSTFHSSY